MGTEDVKGLDLEPIKEKFPAFALLRWHPSIVVRKLESDFLAGRAVAEKIR